MYSGVQTFPDVISPSTSRPCATSSRRSPSIARRAGSGRGSCARASAPRIRVRRRYDCSRAGTGTSLTAIEPHNNIVRIAMQALAIVLSGAQAVHTISWDEAIGIPTEASSLLALRTQQILAYETGGALHRGPAVAGATSSNR